MYDKERIARMLNDIDRYFGDFEKIKIIKASDLEDKQKFYSASMILFSIINRAIDLANEMIVANNFKIAATYRETFDILSKNNLISKELAEEMTDLIYYRNNLSHQYHDFDEKKLFAVCKKIETAKAFTKRAKELIRK